MKTLIAIPLLFAACACARADEAADRAAIGRVVAALNAIESGKEGKREAASLFTANAENELPQLLNPALRQPWSETTKPALALRSVRFVAPDVALAEADYTQIGSTIVRRVPVLLVMKKEGAEWRIASLRLLHGGLGLRGVGLRPAMPAFVPAFLR